MTTLLMLTGFTDALLNFRQSIPRGLRGVLAGFDPLPMSLDRQHPVKTLDRAFCDIVIKPLISLVETHFSRIKHKHLKIVK